MAQLLHHANDRIIHLLEGPDAAVGRAQGRMAADPRHHSIVTILDREAPARLFPELAAFSLPGAADQPHDLLADEADAAQQAATRGDTTSLFELIASPSAGAITNSLRVMPRQPRAIDTVDRLLAAVERLVTSHGPDKLTVRDVALEANVTSQTAYRYFQHTDDLLRVFVSRRQASVLQRVRANLLQGQFNSEAEIASSMITLLFAALQKKRAVPQAFWHFVLRRHHDLQYDEIWSLAEAVLAAMRRCSISCAHITRVEIASGLTAAIAAAKGIALYDPAFFRTPACRALLISLFQSTLGIAARR